MDKFEAIFVIFLLTWAAVSVFGSSPDISTTAGDTVNIPCVFGEGTLRNIYWYYNDGTGPQKILFLREGVLAIDPEYADRANLQNDNATLILKDIAVADEGIYRCDVDRQGQTPVPNINTKLNVFMITNCTGESASCIIQANQSPPLPAYSPTFILLKIPNSFGTRMEKVYHILMK
ncbi:T-lymphocyte activation antigen CD86-like [Strongylocentrotus purpuratus]|uniref:Ig-like domain-containing protein n=1 Tax=Strongylocentrotus purpuratus TaxID=7668 RepID=A0A7M7NES6_STRPU|nr:T-lymphocyte activation antigen CD86-like [Strongylocentrotus purpuratus]